MVNWLTIFSFIIRLPWICGRLIWSKLGYAKVSCGTPSLLARVVWPSSEWSYMDNCSPLSNVGLWRERNSRCFEDNDRSISYLKLFFFRTLVDWLSALRNQSFSSFLEFLDLCHFCTWFVWLLYASRVLGHPFFIIILLLIKKKKVWDDPFRQIHFLPPNLVSFTYAIGSQIELALKEAPKGNPNSKYFIGRDEIWHPKLLANSSMFGTSPIGMISDLPKSIHKPETASKHKDTMKISNVCRIYLTKKVYHLQWGDEI